MRSFAVFVSFGGSSRNCSQTEECTRVQGGTHTSTCADRVLAGSASRRAAWSTYLWIFGKKTVELFLDVRPANPA